MAFQKIKILSLVLALMILTGLTTGCGLQGPMAPARPDGVHEDRLHTQSREQIISEINWKTLPPGTPIDKTNYVNDDPQNYVMANQEFNVQFDLDIPYGTAFQNLSTGLNEIIPRACEPINSILKELPDRYNPGEIPCGKIINNNWKELTSINVPKYKDKHYGFEVRTDSFKAPIRIRRNQRTGSYNERSLDTKKNEKMTSSREFGKDISLRYDPRIDSGLLEVCINLPGFEIQVPERKVKAKAKRKVIGINISHSETFEIDFGTARFDMSRVCLGTIVTIDPDTYKPHFEITGLVYPALQNITHNGMKIKIKGWFTQVLDNIARFFRLNIRDIVIKEFKKEFTDLKQNDLDTGKWLLKVNKNIVEEELSRILNEELIDKLYKNGPNLSSQALKKRLIRQCKKLGILNHAKNPLQTFYQSCETLIGLSEIGITPFPRTQEMAEKGCYSYMARIHDSQDTNGNDKWWANDCKFSFQVHARFPVEVEDYKDALLLVLNSMIRSIEVPEDLRELFGRNRLNNSELDKIVDYFEGQGIRRPTSEDLKRLGSNVIRQLL